jgi:transcriptional regulator with XRE-family HTH domain
MISIEQMKAARALLEWTQEDLAEAAGLSKPSVNTLERRIANPKIETLEAIQRALEGAGIEFTEGPGVKLRSAVLKTVIWEGGDSLLRLLHDIFTTLNGTKNELMIAGVAEEKYIGLGGERVLAEIQKRVKYGVKTRILIREGDKNFVEPIAHYRWIPEALFTPTPTYIYDNKYAILLWGPPQKIVLIENAEVAESFRKQFDAHWNIAKEPTA